jgi:CRP-like cAMP-binding protein
MRQGHEVPEGLSRSYLFEGMTLEQLGPLAAVATMRRLVRGEFVFHLGDRADELFVVLTGELKTFVIDADGYEVVHFLHGPGMTIGEPGYFSVERSRIVETVAVAPSALIRLHRRDLAPFIERHGNVKDRALEGLASNTRWQTTMISSLASRPLKERLVLRLLELVDSSPKGRSGRAVTPKISQSMLAAMVGVSRENVNRALSALTAGGSIRLERGRYVLVDEERLRRELARDWPLVGRRDRRTDSLET